MKLFSAPPGRAMAGALWLLLLATPVLAQLSITFPVNRIVLQRNNQNEARLVIAGRSDQPADRIEARLEVVQGGQAQEWRSIDETLDNGAFSGSLTAKGGWYRLQVRAVRGGSAVGSVSTIERVGVGEVFLIVGHSNAQGGSSPPLPAASLTSRERVISINPGRDPERFRLYDQTGNADYLPGLEFSELCATCGMAPFISDQSWFWGRLGERLVERLNVPVLLYSTAFGGSNMEQMYKAAHDIPFEHGFIRYGIRMPYRNVQVALQKYIPTTGVRAILSGHGINDQGNTRENFRFYYEKVIEKTRQEASNPELTWVVAPSAFAGDVKQHIVEGQWDIIGRQARNPNIFKGAELNQIGLDGRTDRLHFNQSGQEAAARLWDQALTLEFFDLSKPQLSRTPTVVGTPTPPTDTQAPGLPTNLRTSNVAQTSLTLSWDAATDNVGVTGYDVFRANVLIGTVTGTTYNVTGLTAGTAYTFSVRAKDAAGNTSAPGSTTVTTASAGTTPPTTPPPSGCTTVYLSDLAWQRADNAWGPVERDRSNGEQAAGDGRTITVRGEQYAKGLGVHAASRIVYALGGTWNRFKADLGIDDEVAVGAPASVVFEVWADGQRIYQSSVLRRNSPIVGINLDVAGRQQLELVVTNGGDSDNSDHADWAAARLERDCPSADTQAPSVPTNLRTSSVTQTELTLAWDAATDNVGVTGYDVFRANVLIGTVTGTTYNVTGLTAGTAYTFSVRAKDAAGNTSAPGSTTVTTASAGSTPPTTPPPSGCTTVYLSDLSWTSATNGWGPAEKDRANGEQAAGDGPTLRLNGKTYAKGIGVHSHSEIVYQLGGTWSRFKADIGLDDSKDNSPGSIVFEVWADGQRLYQSGIMRAATATAQVDVDLTGRQQLRLVVTDAGNGVDSDHGDWADARLERSCGGTPPPVADTQAPGVPGNVRTGSVTQTGLTLSWDASTDNVGVTGYDLYQGSTLLGSVTGTSYNVTGLTGGTQYTFSVRAKDAAGNVSTPGSTSVTTAAPATTPPPAGGCTPTTTYLSDLSWTSVENGWGPVERDRANGENSAGDGPALKLGTKTYAKGLGVHSRSEISYALGGSYTRFKADIGLADYITEFGSVVFEVFIDGTKAYESGLMTPGQVKAVDLEVTGKQQLRLVVTNADGRGRGDHANWADARLERTCLTPNTRTTALRTLAPEASLPARVAGAEVPAGAVQLVPNPAQTETVVAYASAYRGPVQIRVRSAAGYLVRQQEITQTADYARYPLSVRGLPPGLYVVTVTLGAEMRSARLQVLP
jgi:chitodextrinase